MGAKDFSVGRKINFLSHSPATLKNVWNVHGSDAKKIENVAACCLDSLFQGNRMIFNITLHFFDGSSMAGVTNIYTLDHACEHFAHKFSVI